MALSTGLSPAVVTGGAGRAGPRSRVDPSPTAGGTPFQRFETRAILRPVVAAENLPQHLRGVQPHPLSLATTDAVSFDFLSSTY